MQPHQNTNGTCHRARIINPKIYTEPQKTVNSESNVEKQEKVGGITLTEIKP